MPLVRFDQDPELQPGAGLFTADDGSSFFAHDPAMAAQLSPDLQAAAAPPPDDRQALAGFPDTGARLAAQDAAGGQQPPTVPASMNDSGGPVQGPVGPPQASGAPPAPRSPALGQAEQLQGNIDAYAMRPVHEAPRKGGVVPTTQQQVRETSGVPYNAEDAADRANVSINKGLAYSEQQNAQAARAAGEAAAYQAAVPQLQEQARIAQMRRDMQERQYRRDRDDLEKAIDDSDKSAKSFNANRWFEDRGAIGSIGAGIAQAFGAASAALTGGPNVVLQQINGYIDRDIANQRAQIEAGKAGADNALAKLNRQFGNLDQAEAALKIAQQKKVETMAQSYAASTKSEDVQKALDVWLADNAERRLAQEQQFQNAAYGKTSLTTAAKVIPGSAGGDRAPTEAEVQQRYNTLEKRGNVVGGTYEGEIKRQKALGMDPEKKKDLQAQAKDLAGAEKELVEGQTAMEPLRNLSRKYHGGDIPGWGAVASKTPGRLLSAEQRQNQQTINLAVPQLVISMFGRGAERNQALIDQVQGSLVGVHSAEDLRAQLDHYDKIIAERRKSLRAGYDPEAVKLIDKNGGYSPPSSLPKSAKEYGE